MASSAADDDAASAESEHGLAPEAVPDEPLNGFPLPMELFGRILRYLTPIELSAVSRVCRLLNRAANDDQLWRAFVQENVPGTTVTSPAPCASFRALYAAHDPYWFLPRYKIWIGGANNMRGKVVIARFDPDHGRIEGYQLLAIPWNNDHPQPPAQDSFSRATSMANFVLFTESPEIMIDPLSNPRRIVRPDHQPPPPPAQTAVATASSSASASAPASAVPLPAPLPAPLPVPWPAPLPAHLPQPLSLCDVPMMTKHHYDELGFLRRKLIFAVRVSHLEENQVWELPENLWPPLPIPAPDRVICQYSHAAVQSYYGVVTGVNIGHEVALRPRRRAALSDHGFHVRTWVDSTPVFAQGTDNKVVFVPQPHLHRRIDDLDTFATIDPVYYTPTADKPFRGIFVGDYGVHGYELVLMHQPDDDRPFDERAHIHPRLRGETDAAYEERRRHACVYRGRLEAVKLTGDPSVPRGEITFVAGDLSSVDYRPRSPGIIAGSELESLRRIHCSGHVAEPGFRFDKYVPCQLFLISPDRIANYWIQLNHVTYYQRIDIDFFTRPHVTRVNPVQAG